MGLGGSVWASTPAERHMKEQVWLEWALKGRAVAHNTPSLLTTAGDVFLSLSASPSLSFPFPFLSFLFYLFLSSYLKLYTALGPPFPP